MDLFVGGDRSRFIGLQILAIEGVAGGCSLLAVYGLFRELENRDRKGRVLGWILTVV